MSEDLIRQVYEYNDTACDFVEAGLYEEALEYFNKSIELHPMEKVYVNIGIICIRHLKDYAKAIKYLDTAVELFPASDNCYSTRGLAYENLKQYEKALSDYKKALALNPDDTDTLNCSKRVQALMAEGTAEYYHELAINEAMNGNVEQGIDIMTKAIEACSDNELLVSSYNSRGLFYCGLNNKEEALKDFSKAIEIQPYHPEAYVYNGIITYMLEGKFENTNSLIIACLLIKKQGRDVYEYLNETARKLFQNIGVPEANIVNLVNGFTNTFEVLINNITLSEFSIDEAIEEFMQRRRDGMNNKAYIEHSTSRKLDL